jgi:ribulose-5-phosphate 4-epimerase/fuculose-1-phosphate aldolase
MGDELDAARQEVARACRVMAHTGLVDDVLGHVSVRVDEDRLLVRCRGPRERGLRFTEPADVRLVSFAGEVLDDDGSSWRPPSELAIHTELRRARPVVGAVVHAHPRAVVVASLAGLPLLPIVGAFDIPAMRLAEAGIATYPRSVLVHRPDLGRELADAMGAAEACVLVGHGLVTTGATVAGAVLRALAVTSLAALSLAVVGAGGTLVPTPESDRAELPDLGSAFNEDLLWRHHLATLAADGWDLT